MYIYADPASNVMGKRKTKEQHDKATLPEIYDYDKVLAALSAFTTLCFIVVSPWVVLRGTQSLRRISAWVASAAFLFNAHWAVFEVNWKAASIPICAIRTHGLC